MYGGDDVDKGIVAEGGLKQAIGKMRCPGKFAGIAVKTDSIAPPVVRISRSKMKKSTGGDDGSPSLDEMAGCV